MRIRRTPSMKLQGEDRLARFAAKGNPRSCLLRVRDRPEMPCRSSRAGERKLSIGERPTVSARVGTGGAHAIRHEANRLHGARAFEMADALQPVALARERIQHLLTEITFDGERAIAVMGK